MVCPKGDDLLMIRCEQSRLRVAALLLAAVFFGSALAPRPSLCASEGSTDARTSSAWHVIYLEQGVPQSLSPAAGPRQLFSPVPGTPVTYFDAAAGIVVGTRAGALGVARADLLPRWIDLRALAGDDFYASLVRLSPDGACALIGGYNAGGEPPGFRLLRVDTKSSEVNAVNLTKHQSPLLLRDIRFSPDGTAFVLLVDESLPASKLFALRGDTLHKVWDSTKVFAAIGAAARDSAPAGYLSLVLADYFPLGDGLLLVVYIVGEEEGELVQHGEVWRFDLAASRTTRRFLLPNPNPDRYFNTSFAVSGGGIYFVRLGGLGQDGSAGEAVLSVSLHRLDLGTGDTSELMSLSVDNPPESPFYQALLFPKLSALTLIHGKQPDFRAHLLSFRGLDLLPGGLRVGLESDRLLLVSP